MVQILIFDTETNGLPNKPALFGNAEKDNWPDVLSICWMIYEDTTLVKTEYHLIKPDGWPVKGEGVHGLTAAMLENGKPLAEVMSVFKADIENSRYIVAHNLRFDKNVVASALKWRLGIETKDIKALWPSTKDICTACRGKEIYKLKTFPKLDVLYETIFGMKAPEGAHNALRDVEVLSAVFFAKFWPEIGKAGGRRSRNKTRRNRRRQTSRNYRK